MKTASLVLGIIGGVLAVIFALVFIFVGAAAGAMMGGLGDVANQLEEQGVTVDQSQLDQATAVANAAVGSLWIIGILSIVGAVLGIIGGVMAKKKGILAGIFMVVAAIPSFFTGLGIIASILFIVGGVLAFIPEKPAAAPAA